MKNTYKDCIRRSPAQTKMSTKYVQILWYQPFPETMPCLWKKGTECSKIGHFRVVCRSRRANTVNEAEQEVVQDSAEKNSSDSVNINSIHFNKNHSIITAKLKMSAGINNIIAPYKVDTGNDGNIMPLQIYKKLFPRITSGKLAATKNESVQLKTYNKTIITQLGTCAVEIEHKNNKK